MKKSILISVFVCLFLGTVGTLSAATKKKPLSLEPIEIDKIIQSDEYIDVIADPRLEIIGIICRLAGYRVFTNYYVGEATYTTQIDSYFSKYKDDKVVTLAKAYLSRGMNANAMISLAYHIKPDFSGTVVDFSTLPDTLNYTWKKFRTNEIYKFITLVHDFVIKTNYPRLLILTRGELLSSVGHFLNDYRNNAICEWAEEFFGETLFDRQVISINKICPLVTSFDVVYDRDGKSTAYSTIYPNCYFDDLYLSYFSNFTNYYLSSIWDNIKDSAYPIVIDVMKKSGQEDVKIDKNKDDASIKKGFVIYLSAFVALEFLRSDLYIEKHKTDESYYTYEAAFGSLEKFITSDWFYKATELMEEYVNSDEYETFADLLPKIEQLVNSIKIEEDKK